MKASVTMLVRLSVTASRAARLPRFMSQAAIVTTAIPAGTSSEMSCGHTGLLLAKSLPLIDIAAE